MNVRNDRPIFIIDGPDLTIPFPLPTQNVNRGYKTFTPTTKPTTIRYNDADKASIIRVSTRLNMSFGEFVRWVSTYAADEVIKELDRRDHTSKNTPAHAERTVRQIDTDGYK